MPFPSFRFPLDIMSISSFVVFNNPILFAPGYVHGIAEFPDIDAVIKLHESKI